MQDPLVLLLNQAFQFGDVLVSPLYFSLEFFSESLSNLLLLIPVFRYLVNGLLQMVLHGQEFVILNLDLLLLFQLLLQFQYSVVCLSKDGVVCLGLL